MKKYSKMVRNRIRLSFNISKTGIFLLFFFMVLPFFAFPSLHKAEGVELDTLSVNLNKTDISVSAELKFDETQINDLRHGIQKELEFYIDLFKTWNFWPDEFISGIKIVRSIKSDLVKNEFSLISYNEASITEHRFNSLDTLLSQALKLNDICCLSTEGLLPGEYFVKVSVVSRIRKLTPIIGYFLFFVPEKEFTIEKDSIPFPVTTR